MLGPHLMLQNLNKVRIGASRQFEAPPNVSLQCIQIISDAFSITHWLIHQRGRARLTQQTHSSVRLCAVVYCVQFFLVSASMMSHYFDLFGSVGVRSSEVQKHTCSYYLSPYGATKQNGVKVLEIVTLKAGCIIDL